MLNGRIHWRLSQIVQKMKKAAKHKAEQTKDEVNHEIYAKQWPAFQKLCLAALLVIVWQMGWQTTITVCHIRAKLLLCIICATVMLPARILCVGLNSIQHVQSAAIGLYKLIFTAYGNSILSQPIINFWSVFSVCCYTAKPVDILGI